MSARPLLVTGASGLLGWHLARIASSSRNVIAAGGRHAPDLSAARCQQFDLADPEATARALEQWTPSVIIHCAAISKPNDCEADPEASHRINVEATEQLAAYAAHHAIPFAFTSTDLVFDGQAGHYPETATPNPVNRYGEQKLAAEKAVLQVYPDAAVCRCPLMYGIPSPHASSFLGFMFEALDSGTPCQLFSDEFRSVANVEDVAAGLLRAIDSSWSGLFHLGGPDRLSRYDIGLILARHAGKDPALFTPLTQAELTMAAPRPPDVSFDSNKAYALGYKPMTAEVGLKKVVDARSA